MWRDVATAHDIFHLAEVRRLSWPELGATSSELEHYLNWLKRVQKFEAKFKERDNLFYKLTVCE